MAQAKHPGSPDLKRSPAQSRANLALVVAVAAGVLSVGSAYVNKTVIDSYASAGASVSPEAVRQALLANPRVLIEAGQKLQAEAAEAEQRASVALVDAAAGELFADSRGFLGNPAGKKVVVEFFDYQCSFCRAAAPELEQAVRDDPELKIVLREMPVLGDGSVVASLAALAAARQGLYMAVHSALLKAPLPLTEKVILSAASSAGADLDCLRADMDSEEVRRELTQAVSLSRRVGATSTPTFAAASSGLLKGFGTQDRFRAFLGSGPR